VLSPLKIKESGMAEKQQPSAVSNQLSANGAITIYINAFRSRPSFDPSFPESLLLRADSRTPMENDMPGTDKSVIILKAGKRLALSNELSSEKRNLRCP